jgi:Na+-driven multidrug efflux pump
MLSEFRRLGLPAVISDTLLALASSVTSIILGHMGKEIVSAYAIVTVVDRLCTVAIGGVCSASSVVIGQSVGEGEFKRAQKEGWTFLFMSIILGFFGMLLVMTIGEWSIGLYDITAQTHSVAVAMMEASAIVVLFQSVQSAMSKGILRGGGDTKFLMVADVLFMWCADIPLGYLAGLVWGWSPFWVLICIRIDNIIKSFWLVSRLKSGKWIHKTKKIEA